MGKKKIKDLLLYIFITLGTIIVYNESSRLWIADIGYNYGVIISEFPFILILLLLLYFPKIKNRWVKYLIPIVPILISYICFDVFFIFLRRIPRWSDLSNIWMMFNFSPFLGGLAITMLSFIPVSILLLFVFAYKSYEEKQKQFGQTILIRGVIFGLLIGLIFSEYGAEIQNVNYDDKPWSQEMSIRFNGRFAFFLYQTNMGKNNYQILKNFENTNSNIQNKIFPGTITNKRNVHIIVLETFMDPRLFNGLNFNRTPLAKELTPFLNNGQFSLVNSPIYGGGTAQAEFELLTGVKAFQKFGRPEFNVMMGNKINAFVAKLKENGYQSIATIAPSSEYYNSAHAYTSLGFDSLIFLEEVNPPIIKQGDWHIFDGDVFAYNLEVLKQELKNNRPVINYVLGMYGHYPFRRNNKLRPDIIKLKNGNAKLKRMMNQFYYRTKALGDHLKSLVSLDPDSIILVISDHIVGGFETKEISYAYSNRSNIAIYLNNTEFIDVTSYQYFDIPQLIWNHLSGEKGHRHLGEDEMFEYYYQALSESLAK
jgi:phosphoglycerol transferase MdoB-like AlkP superfamily enzyme